jgi:uncharacterized protein YqeY
MELFRAGGRGAMADGEQAEAAILTEFLPEQIAAEEVERIVRAAITETGASSPADMGKVMGHVLPQTKGRADSRAISELVRQLLAG